MCRSLPGVLYLVAPHCQIPLSGTSVFWMGALCETVSIQVWFKWRNENQEIRLLGFSGGKKKRSKEGPRERSADVVEVATTTSTGEDTVGEKVVMLEESLTFAGSFSTKTTAFNRREKLHSLVTEGPRLSAAK